MIKNPIDYSVEEQELIDSLMGEQVFCANSWSDHKLADLKGRIKQHYVAEQGYRCCYCYQVIYTEHGRNWDLEHVIARSIDKRFMFEPRNLAIACIECNQEKGNEPVARTDRVRFPTRSESYYIVHPHFDDWEEHLEIEGEVTYRALSEKGKFTIYHCDLFRFWERRAKIDRPIRDSRFERDIGELRFAKSPEEAEPIVASIMSRLAIEQRRVGSENPD